MNADRFKYKEITDIILRRERQRDISVFFRGKVIGEEKNQ
jgi:hypothetical protein